MIRKFSRCAGVVGVLTLAAALPASAADLDKYLPDDTDFVLTVNVKQILATPAFAKHYQKKVDDLLKMEPVPLLLKDSGFDPLKDVDRVLVAMGKGFHQVDVDPNTGATSSSGGGPMLLVQGRFDSAKLKAKADQLVKDFPQFLKIHKSWAAPIYEIRDGQRSIYFVAVLDPTTLVAAARQSNAVEVLERAAGKAKAQFQHPDLPRTLNALDPMLNIEAVGLSDMIVGTSVSSRTENGKTTTEVKYTTLADSGLKGFHGQVMIDKDVQIKLVLSAKDPDRAKELAKTIDEGAKKAIEEISKESASDKEYAALVQAMKSLKINAKNATLTLEASGEANAGVAFVKAWFTVRAVDAPPKAIEKKEVKPLRPNP
jgi:hypothetical protein